MIRVEKTREVKQKLSKAYILEKRKMLKEKHNVRVKK